MSRSIPSAPRRAAVIACATVITAVLPAASQRGTAAQDSAFPGATPPAPTASLGTVVDFAADRDKIFDAFHRIGLDTSKPLAVANLTIRKDSMAFALKQGTLFLVRPIAGEITGAVFVGDGEASMTPPNRTIAYMLKKYYGTEVLKEPFSEALFRFTDDTAAALIAAGRQDAGGVSQASRATKVYEERNAWLDNDRGGSLEMEWLENRIAGHRGVDPFMADFHSAKYDWITYTHTPRSYHENAIFRGHSIGGGKRYTVTWAEWHKREDYAPDGHYMVGADRDGPRAIRIQHTEMVIDLKNTKTVEWEARIRVEPLSDGLRCVLFDNDSNADYSTRWDNDTFYPIRVLSVTDDSGQPHPFTHKKDGLLVLLPPNVKAGAAITLVFKGTAEVIYQVTAESFGLMQASWYPHYSRRRSSFFWTVRVPKSYLISGSGKIVREYEDKATGQNVRESKCDEQVDFPWAIFGRFIKAASVYDGAESKKSIPLTIHSFPYMTYSVTDPFILELYGLSGPFTDELTAPPKKTEDIFAEAKEILKLYEHLYGPYPYDELHIAQMAPFMGFGQAPQGFVQLTGEAFMSQGRTQSDFFHGFFAHEIAHQWWGHQVDGATDNDTWLSEGFAEYASGIFVKEYQGAKRFQRQLEEWRVRAKQADSAAPISEANTLFGPPGGFRNRTFLLYSKAPYVLHMLRVQLGDENYVKVMRAIQVKYRNRAITTEMFIRELNTIMGSNYTDFFDQWFWGTGIPTFRYSWRSERQPDGKYLVTVHVSQDDKKNLKKVLMPIHIHLKDKTIPQYKPVVQAEQDIKFMLPVEPKNVTLDDDRTLLADIVKAV